MAILRPLIVPSLGLPNQIVAPPQKRANMAQPSFFAAQKQNPLQQSQQPLDVTKGLQQVSDSVYRPDQEKFDQEPLTGDYIAKQLQSYAQRQAVPQLQPGARVQAPDEALVNPENFQSFYDRLGSIENIGNELLGAAQARSAFQRIQQLNAINNQSVKTPSGSSGGNYGSAKGNIPANPRENFKYAQAIAGNYGWGPDELAAWYTLGMKESGWDNGAQNPTSTAYGIGQFLDSTWKGVGGTKTSDPRLQVEYMARYIKNRYGSPSRALAFHNAHNWY